ncbi:MAG: PQQ-dependent sugar dehydrogenase [Deltaproteobacteria bacterium]|nr:PQQ-dependent sugar dehydrogenase [Deltaproteobacteria bacterium]
MWRPWPERKIKRFNRQVKRAANNKTIRAKRKKNALYKGISKRKLRQFIGQCEQFVPTVIGPVPTQDSTPPPSTTIAPTIAPEQTLPPVATPPITSSVPNLDLETVIGGLDQPLYITHSNDQTGRLFVVEQGGRILVLQNGSSVPGEFLNISGLVSTGSEQGLLSIAFHPNFTQNGRFFINYTDVAGDTVIAEYSVSAENPNQADLSSRREILTFDQPATNHNGGLLKFGPDGMMYVASGDGGPGNDPFDRGQDLNTLLGKILRIDVNQPAGYAIPADNPFVGMTGTQPEIWAYGLRNPWRFSFDRVDGTMFLADVGQSTREEVDIITRGGNYGWSTMEGSLCFNPSTDCDQTGLQLPISEYGRSEGGSITGGYRYRGAEIADLYGKYLFGDFLSGRAWVLIPEADGSWRREQVLPASSMAISSFGEDEAGELYLVDYNGSVLRIREGI